MVGIGVVTDVAFAFGFNDLSHFSRVFKKAFTVSPQRFAADVRSRISRPEH
ncbi:helix-turn-helix domain-containing protein [Panacagrimonas perspica]|uniref:helix-turn-helix domain-containing protein n=1 Tax=Panacagrimonas perspica TaxID=381431 RepID=UPI00344EF83A